MANLFFFLPLLLPLSLSLSPSFSLSPFSRERPGWSKVSIFIKISFEKYDFDCSGWPGRERPGWKKYRFLLRCLLKSNGFDCPGWPGAAGREKKYRFSLKFLLKSNDFDCPGWPGATRGRGTPQIPLSLAPKVMVSGGAQGTHRYHCLWRQRQWYLGGHMGTHRYHCLWRQRQWYLGGTFCKSYRILFLQGHYYGGHSEGPGGVL